MGLIASLILGAISGWIASKIMGTNKQKSFIMNIVVGMLGGVIGGAVMNYIGGQGVTGFNIWSLFVSVIGAIILIAISRKISK